jgi:hypothetical protein
MFNNYKIIKAFYVAVLSLLLSSQAFALGVDELAGRHIGYMVTDDMLANADKAPVFPGKVSSDLPEFFPWWEEPTFE